jgi:SAM-dependent methyltransferase
MTANDSSSDWINKRTWKTKRALRTYGTAEGFTDSGEEMAFNRVREDARRGRTLDIGVGGGRTTRIALAESRNYIGIDYTAELIEICREKFPGVDFECADARDLSRFGSESFDLVQFSFNGICSIDGDGRHSVFREVFRVLRPGGAFLFSTFFLVDQRGKAAELTLRKISLSANPVHSALSLAKYVTGTAIGLWRRVHYRKLEKFNGESAVFLHGAHDYGFLCHATTLPALRSDLRGHGYAAPVTLISQSGKVVSENEKTEGDYCHVIARKPTSR